MARQGLISAGGGAAEARARGGEGGAGAARARAAADEVELAGLEMGARARGAVRAMLMRWEGLLAEREARVAALESALARRA
jgi:hypothetical protein